MNFLRYAGVFSIVCLLMTSSVVFAADVPGVDYVNDQFVISVQRGVELKIDGRIDGENTVATGYESINQLILSNGVTAIEPFYSGVLRKEALRDVVGRMYIFTISSPENLQEAISAFDNDPNIEFAEPYYINHLDYVPNDPLISSWYHLTNIESYIAWDVIRGDSTDRAIVGIVDSGVYYDHPDLEPNMWINPIEDINQDGQFTNDDINGIDDDGNGKIDDVVGYDLAMNDPYPMEPIPWHGTHVAGCVTMATDNGYGGAATGWAARIMAVKAARDNDPNSISHGYAGIIYAAENGCNVINLSWGRGGSYSQGEQNVITAAYNSNVVVVAAAGNSNTSAQHWPAAYDHVVSVAATDINDHKASYSNYGSWIDVSAPGDNVISTWDHGSFTALSGTSMASPVTAGVVCLLRSAHPDWGVDDIVEQLVTTTDDIDDLNPGYERMLGSGRVNAASAVGRDILPRLEIASTEMTLTEDDGDEILNPSESFELVVTLSNAWADANNVVGTLRSDDQFTVTDSMANFGNITGEGGEGDNSSSPFAVTVDSDALVGNHILTLAITADGYATEADVEVYVSLEQLGFPREIPDIIESSPLVFDVDMDGSQEIIISANDNKYYSFDSDGTISDGWPKTVDDICPAGAAIGDLDDDGDYEIVGASKSGSIYAWTPNGTLLDGFPYDAGPVMFATPSLGDIDGDGDLEIVTAGFGSRKVFVLDHDGSDHDGWPFQGDAVFYSSGALADIDNDDLPEIIFCDFDSYLHAWNSDQSYVEGFPVTLSGPVQASPAVADIDGDGNLDIVVAVFSGDVYVVENDGSIMTGWPVALGSNLKSSPSLADIDQDGHLEIILGDNNGNLNVLNSNGLPQSGFPVSTEGSISGSPVVGDINGDGGPDIVVGSSEGFLYAFNGQGQALANFPIPTITGGSIANSAGLADLDGDGDVEIVIGARSPGQNLEVIDYKYDVSNMEFLWPFYCNDVARTAFYGDFITGIDDEIDSRPITFDLIGNYPNPFNANTIIKFSIPSASEVELSIFDILGRKIKTFQSGRLEAGIHEFVWNGTDDGNGPVSSGVYFYNIQFGEQSITKRMVMVK